MQTQACCAVSCPKTRARVKLRFAASTKAVCARPFECCTANIQHVPNDKTRLERASNCSTLACCAVSYHETCAVVKLQSVAGTKAVCAGSSECCTAPILHVLSDKRGLEHTSNCSTQACCATAPEPEWRSQRLCNAANLQEQVPLHAAALQGRYLGLPPVLSLQCGADVVTNLWQNRRGSASTSKRISNQSMQGRSPHRAQYTDVLPTHLARIIYNARRGKLHYLPAHQRQHQAATQHGYAASATNSMLMQVTLSYTAW